MKTLKKLSQYLGIFLVFIAAPVLAADPISTGTFSSTAVDGYDTVAYFTEGKAVEGSSEFKTEYMDATWKFSSAKNLALFQKNPTKYAPQYGGYCAFAVAQGSLASGDPEQWKIHKGKLYLNYNAHIKGRWLEDVPGYIADGNKNFPGLVD